RRSRGLSRNRRGGGGGGQCFRLTAAFLWALFSASFRSSLLLPHATTANGRRRWRRLGRRIRREELDDLVVGTQSAIHEQQEGLVQGLLVLRMLGCDSHLRHFRKGEFLAQLRPFGQEILELLMHRRRPRRNRGKQHSLRPAVHQELPRGGWLRQVPSHQSFGKVLGIIFHVAPALDKTLVGKLALDGRDVFVAQ